MIFRNFILVLATLVSAPIAGVPTILASPRHVSERDSSVHFSLQTGINLHLHADAPGGHFCGTDFSSKEARSALAAFASAKKAGLYPIVRKGGSPPEVGDEQTFNVSEDEWIQLTFRLVDKTGFYNLWVETEEISNGNVTTSEIASLRAMIHDSTPSRSVKPDQGIFANNHDIFGLPPDINGDSVVDILMYDIGRGSGNTLGYVSSADMLVPPPNSVTGNQREVLYLDSNEGTRNLTTMAVIVAHEYAHLIHLSYEWDASFITEGYAEYAMVMNGYFWRGVNYMNSVAEVLGSLFNWRDGGGPSQQDYERGGLFFTYIASQVGPAAIGEMMRGLNKKGGAGIDSVLALHNSSLSVILLDFHTANFFNDTSLDARFGYSEPERSFHHANLSESSVNGEVESALSEGGFTNIFEKTISSGSVFYKRYLDVADFTFTYDTPTSDVFGEGFQEFVRSRNQARVALKRDGSDAVEFLEIEPGPLTQSIPGSFQWITFIFVHESPGISIGDRTSLESFWTPLSRVTDTESEDEIPGAFSLGRNYPNPFNPATSIPVTLDRTQEVRLEVYDLLGRRMSVLHDRMLTAGIHTFTVRADNWPSGMYLYRLTTLASVQTRTMTLLK